MSIGSRKYKARQHHGRLHCRPRWGRPNGSEELSVGPQGLVQTLLVRLPMAYFMSIQPNASLTKIGLAAPVSTTVGVVLNIAFYMYLNRAEQRKQRTAA